MPLYEYECSACGRRFELIRRFSDPPADTCPVCGSGPVRKLQSSPAIQFKGSGWYITDYAKKDQKPGQKADDTSGSGDAAATKDTAAKDKTAKDKTKEKTDTGGKSSKGATGTSSSPPASSSTKDSKKS
jgi:putative FmdB family regulatory protein